MDKTPDLSRVVTREEALEVDVESPVVGEMPAPSGRSLKNPTPVEREMPGHEEIDHDEVEA